MNTSIRYLTSLILVFPLLVTYWACEQKAPDVELKEKPQPFSERLDSSKEKKLPMLEERAEKLARECGPERRHHVDELYSLAELYTLEGKLAKAKETYDNALMVDAWNLKRQLEAAKVLHALGDKNQAYEKAKLVRKYAENWAIVESADTLLHELGISTDIAPILPQSRLLSGLSLVIVQMGDISKGFLVELSDYLHRNTGVRCVLADTNLALGSYDRTYADQYMDDLIDQFQKMVTRREYYRTGTRIEKHFNNLRTYNDKYAFVQDFMKRMDISNEELVKFQYKVIELKQHGQYSAHRLCKQLDSTFSKRYKDNLSIYLGVTMGDIYEGDTRFLFARCIPGFIVVSLHRARAKFTGETENRSRLIIRAAKNTLALLLWQLKMPRCTDPSCVRTYPHSLKELDQKGAKPCDLCTSWLKKQKRLSLQRMSTQHQLK